MMYLAVLLVLTMVATMVMVILTYRSVHTHASQTNVDTPRHALRMPYNNTGSNALFLKKASSLPSQWTHVNQIEIQCLPPPQPQYRDILLHAKLNVPNVGVLPLAMRTQFKDDGTATLYPQWFIFADEPSTLCITELALHFHPNAVSRTNCAATILETQERVPYYDFVYATSTEPIVTTLTKGMPRYLFVYTQGAKVDFTFQDSSNQTLWNTVFETPDTTSDSNFLLIDFSYTSANATAHMHTGAMQNTFPIFSADTQLDVAKATIQPSVNTFVGFTFE